LQTGYRLHHVTIEARDDSKVTICDYREKALPQGRTTKFTCRPGTIGRFLKLSRPNSNSGDPFNICEVEVYGVNGKDFNSIRVNTIN